MLEFDNDSCETLLRLIEAGAENEVLEFKAASKQFHSDDVGRYFSALSNAANLGGKASAWLVLGVDDQRQVVGSQAFSGSDSLNRLKQQLHQGSNGQGFLRILECCFDGKRVLAFEIPAASSGFPVAWNGHYYDRAGESVVALGLEKLERIRQQGRDSSFETEYAVQGLANDETLALLDYAVYFRQARNYTQLQVERMDRSGILAEMERDRLVASQGGRWAVTNLGAILFARSLTNFPHLLRKAPRVIEYGDGRTLLDSRLSTQHETELYAGYAFLFDHLVEYVLRRLPQHEDLTAPARKTVEVYPRLAVRELVANALIHQDFRVRGAGPMIEIFAGRIEITNPGELIPDPQRLIDAPPRSRNEELAALMRRMKYCEERGSGIDKVVNEVERSHLPPPLFESKESSTRVTLFGPKELSEMTHPEKLRACYQHACLLHESGKMLTNASLRERLNADDVSAVSRIIRDALNDGLIVDAHPESKSKRTKAYLPFWAVLR